MRGVASFVQEQLGGCDGFQVESAGRLLGWIEESWLGPAGVATALAVRTIDGRRGLLRSEAVDAVIPESELILVDGESQLLELDMPHVETASTDAAVISASWTTTGETLEPPPAPGLLQRMLLALRPWRLAPPPAAEAERPLWQLVVVLYAALALIVILVIGLAFLAAHLVAGGAG